MKNLDVRQYAKKKRSLPVAVCGKDGCIGTNDDTNAPP